MQKEADPLAMTSLYLGRFRHTIGRSAWALVQASMTPSKVEVCLPTRISMGQPLGIDLLEQQPVLPGLDDELVLTGQEQLARSLPAGRVQERLRRLKEQRSRLRKIADFTVRQSMKLLRRKFRADLEVLLRR